MADKNEITRFRGDTYPVMAIIKENGIPIDLTGATTKMTIAFKDPGPRTILGIIIPETPGMIRFDFMDEEVTDQVGKFFYDIQVDSGGYKTTYAKNIIVFLRDVTLT